MASCICTSVLRPVSGCGAKLNHIAEFLRAQFAPLGLYSTQVHLLRVDLQTRLVHELFITQVTIDPGVLSDCGMVLSHVPLEPCLRFEGGTAEFTQVLSGLGVLPEVAFPGGGKLFSAVGTGDGLHTPVGCIFLIWIFRTILLVNTISHLVHLASLRTRLLTWFVRYLLMFSLWQNTLPQRVQGKT